MRDWRKQFFFIKGQLSYHFMQLEFRVRNVSAQILLILFLSLTNMKKPK